MNAYDFDNTIYDGESIFDFFKYGLKKDPPLILHFPKVFLSLIKYKLNLLSIDKLNKVSEEVIKSFLKRHNEIDELAKGFWHRNSKKLKPKFLNMLKEDDIIITGCPNFLLDCIKDKLKTKNIISTEFNLETKKIEFICFGKNKVKAFNKKYKGVKINNFYTDSLTDIPFMSCADQVYLVKKNKIVKIDKEKYIKKDLQ